MEVSQVKQQCADTLKWAKQWHSDWEQLKKLDRYERRAPSRRRSAIRASTTRKRLPSRHEPKGAGTGDPFTDAGDGPA